MISKDCNGVSYGPAHEFGLTPDDITSFYKANWQRQISLELPRFYRWQFLEPPESAGKDWNCVGVRGDEILGVMGLNPRPFILRGRTLSAAELTTWIVSEVARGLGVGRGIMRAVQSQFDLAFGFGISDAALPIYTTQGFRRLRYIPRYFRVFSVGAVRAHARVEQLGERLAKQWANVPRITVRSDAVAAETLGDLASILENDHNLYRRDAAHLAWRYDGHPTYRYEAFEVRTPRGEGPVGVILRQDVVDMVKFIHVLDILGAVNDVPIALAFIDDFARNSGAAFVDFYCTSTDVSGHLISGGWFSTSDDTYFQLSHLYYPPEFRPAQTTSMVYWTRGDMAALADLGRLYITKEDLDLDRPTLAYYKTHGVPRR